MQNLRQFDLSLVAFCIMVQLISALKFYLLSSKIKC